MKTRDLAFASRPRLFMVDRFYYGTGGIGFAPYGEHWRQARRVCVTHMLNPRRIVSFGRVRGQEVRALVDRRLARRHVLTDYFFSLKQCLEQHRTPRVFDLAKTATVELMTHPIQPLEYEYLTGGAYASALRAVDAGSYSALCA